MREINECLRNCFRLWLMILVFSDRMNQLLRSNFVHLVWTFVPLYSEGQKFHRSGPCFRFSDCYMLGNQFPFLDVGLGLPEPLIQIYNRQQHWKKPCFKAVKKG